MKNALLYLCRSFHSQELGRIHRLVTAADTEMHMITDGSFQKCGIAHIADGLTQLYGIAGLDQHLLRQAGILGDIAIFMPDHHGHAHGLILIDGIHRAVGGCADLGAFLSGNIHAVVHPPIPCRGIIAEIVHGVDGHGLPLNGGCGLHRLAGDRYCGFGSLGTVGRLLLGLSSHGGNIILYHRQGGRCRYILICRFFAAVIGIAVIQIAADPDSDRTQGQGYVVALTADAFEFFVAHL